MPHLPGKKHCPLSIFVFKCETWRWFSKPSGLTAHRQGCCNLTHTSIRTVPLEPPALAAKHQAQTDLLGFQTGAQERPQQKPVYTVQVFLVHKADVRQDLLNN